jgi:hypothetical protein
MRRSQESVVVFQMAKVAAHYKLETEMLWRHSQDGIDACREWWPRS